MGRLEHDRSGYCYACPACDGAGQVYEREGRHNASINPDRPFLCEKCSTALTYVIERPKKRVAVNGQRTLPMLGERRDSISAHELEAKAPEDVGLTPVGVRGGQP